MRNYWSNLAPVGTSIDLISRDGIARRCVVFRNRANDAKLDRNIVVVVYGQSQRLIDTARSGAEAAPLCCLPDQLENAPIDRSPDYDASGEIEFGGNWLPWILRGSYPRRFSLRRRSTPALNTSSWEPR